jgi:hypothetical protein
MGVAEGSLTAARIWQAFQNFNNSNYYLVGGFLPPVLVDFINTQNEWMAEQIRSTPPEHELYAYWQHLAILLEHARGVADGYQRVCSEQEFLTTEQVYILTMAGDLEDLSAAIPYLNQSWTCAQSTRAPDQPLQRATHRSMVSDSPSVNLPEQASQTYHSSSLPLKVNSKVTPIHMDCSGLVKLATTDLFVGHSEMK